MAFSLRNETGEQEVKKVREAKQCKKYDLFCLLFFEKLEAKRSEIIVDCEERMFYTMNDPAPGNGQRDEEVSLPEGPAGEHHMARVDSRDASCHSCEGLCEL